MFDGTSEPLQKNTLFEKLGDREHKEIFIYSSLINQTLPGFAHFAYVNHCKYVLRELKGFATAAAACCNIVYYSTGSEENVVS